MRCCAAPIPGADRRMTRARQAAPSLLDIASLPSDVAQKGSPSGRSRLGRGERPCNEPSDLFRECRMLVWSAVLIALLATDTARVSAEPKVTITVDSSRKELVLRAGPFDLPNMPPMDEHAMMDRGMSHDTPIEHFDWPIEGWLRGFELDLRDGQGKPVPRRVVHHMIMVNFSRRMLLY